MAEVGIGMPAITSRPAFVNNEQVRVPGYGKSIRWIPRNKRLRDFDYRTAHVGLSVLADLDLQRPLLASFLSILEIAARCLLLQRMGGGDVDGRIETTNGRPLECLERRTNKLRSLGGPDDQAVGMMASLTCD